MKYGEQITSFFKCADDGEVRITSLYGKPSDEDHRLTALECVKLMEEADSWDWVPEGMLNAVCDLLDVDVEAYASEENGVDNDGLFEALYAACEKEN